MFIASAVFVLSIMVLALFLNILSVDEKQLTIESWVAAVTLSLALAMCAAVYVLYKHASTILGLIFMSALCALFLIKAIRAVDSINKPGRYISARDAAKSTILALISIGMTGYLILA